MSTQDEEKLSIYLAYLENAWAKILQFKNRQWSTVIIHNAVYFLMLTQDNAFNFFTSAEWLKVLVISGAPTLSVLTVMFCWHLRSKIGTERKVIEHFEDVYPQHTSQLRIIRRAVSTNDFGDKLVYGGILVFTSVLTILVILRYSGIIICGDAHAAL